MRKEGKRIIIQMEEKKKKRKIRMYTNPEHQGTAKNFTFKIMAVIFPSPDSDRED